MLLAWPKSKALALLGRSWSGSEAGTACGDAALSRRRRRPSRPHCAVDAEPSRDVTPCRSPVLLAGLCWCSTETACRADAAADKFCWKDPEACDGSARRSRDHVVLSPEATAGLSQDWVSSESPPELA